MCPGDFKEVDYLVRSAIAFFSRAISAFKVVFSAFSVAISEISFSCFARVRRTGFSAEVSFFVADAFMVSAFFAAVFLNTTLLCYNILAALLLISHRTRISVNIPRVK